MAVIPLPSPPLPRGRANLVIAGPMGSGKTTCGRLAADTLNVPFFDLDEVIVRRAGASISDIFTTQGEASFRALERQALRDAAKLSGSIIAVGGGAVTHAEFAELAATGVVMVLACDPAQAAQRLASQAANRPLLKDAGEDNLASRLQELIEQRARDYRAAGDELDTTNLTPEEVAMALVGRIRGANHGPVIEIGPAVIGSEPIGELVARIKTALPGARRAIVVADSAVREGIAGRLAAALRSGMQADQIIELPPGEAAKTLESVTSLWTEFGDSSLSRGDVVVAVGGGAALDTAGFAAATFARGVNLVNVPTTLLAMVDASIGGKVGIDFAGTKNAVGSFHPASLVVVDVSNLENLPPDTLRQGLAEVVKAAVLASPLVLHALEDAALNEHGLPQADLLSWLVEQAVRVKLAYVNADPTDNELRHALNLGHTFAHALESATNYEMSHGEAVAIGLVHAARLGESVDVTDPGTSTRLGRLLDRLGLPVEIPATVDRDVTTDRMRTDKKRRDGHVVFVVPTPEGCALLTGVEPHQALVAASLVHA
jgi:shikimate kinase / 3-dehydroquinate synthase